MFVVLVRDLLQLQALKFHAQVIAARCLTSARLFETFTSESQAFLHGIHFSSPTGNQEFLITSSTVSSIFQLSSHHYVDNT